MELLKFEADWCGPCSKQDSIIEEYDATPVRRIDVDEESETAQEWGVRSLPTMILLGDDGESLNRWTGVTQLEDIESALDKYSQ